MLLIDLFNFPCVGGEDYTAFFETLTFVDQSNRECLSVSILVDLTVENMEDFSVTLASSSPQVIITSPSAAIVHIIDDDGKYQNVY